MLQDREKRLTGRCSCQGSKHTWRSITWQPVWQQERSKYPWPWNGSRSLHRQTLLAQLLMARDDTWRSCCTGHTGHSRKGPKAAASSAWEHASRQAATRPAGRGSNTAPPDILPTPLHAHTGAWQERGLHKKPNTPSAHQASSSAQPNPAGCSTPAPLHCPNPPHNDW